MHNLISYIGTTDDHLTSSTALHSDSPTTPASSKADQTAKHEEEGSGTSQGDSEAAGGEEEGGGGEENEGEGEGEGEILEYEPSPDVLKVEVEKWRSSLNYAIDSQDTQTTEKVHITMSTLYGGAKTTGCIKAPYNTNDFPNCMLITKYVQCVDNIDTFELFLR